MLQALPWVRLVASLREPITRFLSMLGHNVDNENPNCLAKCAKWRRWLLAGLGSACMHAPVRLPQPARLPPCCCPAGNPHHWPPAAMGHLSCHAAASCCQRLLQCNCHIPLLPPVFSALPCRHDLYECLRRELPGSNYTSPIQAWLAAFPPQQLKLVQVGGWSGQPQGLGHVFAWMLHAMLAPKKQTRPGQQSTAIAFSADAALLGCSTRA